MVSDKLYKKLMLLRIKKNVAHLDGILDIDILDVVDLEIRELYEKEIYPKIFDFYKYDAKTLCTITYDRNDRNEPLYNNNYSSILEDHLKSYISLGVRYYISYEGKYFFRFEVIDIKKFITSCKKINGMYDLSIFNVNEILVINDNEYDISIHYRQFHPI